MKIEAGFILVALVAVGNAAGRIVAGVVSDRIGRLWTMFAIFIFQAVLMMVLRTGLTDMTAFVVVSAAQEILGRGFNPLSGAD